MDLFLLLEQIQKLQHKYDKKLFTVTFVIRPETIIIQISDMLGKQVFHHTVSEINAHIPEAVDFIAQIERIFSFNPEEKEK